MVIKIYFYTIWWSLMVLQFYSQYLLQKLWFDLFVHISHLTFSIIDYYIFFSPLRNLYYSLLLIFFLMFNILITSSKLFQFLRNTQTSKYTHKFITKLSIQFKYFCINKEEQKKTQRSSERKRSHFCFHLILCFVFIYFYNNLCQMLRSDWTVKIWKGIWNAKKNY